jgi:hypothetical protein
MPDLPARRTINRNRIKLTTPFIRDLDRLRTGCFSRLKAPPAAISKIDGGDTESFINEDAVERHVSCLAGHDRDPRAQISQPAAVQLCIGC